MRIWINIVFVLILLHQNTAWANQACFLFINGEQEGQEFVIDQLIRPVLSSHIQSIKSVPPEGITSKQLESECKFELSLVYTEETLKISLDSKRTKTSIVGYASSRLNWCTNRVFGTLGHNLSCKSSFSLQILTLEVSET